MTAEALVLTHDICSSLRGQPCRETAAMSSTQKARNLADALRIAYPGPAKPKRLADDMGCSIATAQNLLKGIVPAALERFFRLAEKRPAILEHLIKNDWTSRIALAREMATVRSSIEAMERNLESNSNYRRVVVDRLKQAGARPRVAADED